VDNSVSALCAAGDNKNSSDFFLPYKIIIIMIIIIENLQMLSDIQGA